ncbi:HTH-type transcriptional repressor CsiR [Pigmentiphaga humi]|uniref:HTH-type transcriptional repressor CsiR n=1 Tax=Pigmentiphaga humi TaxID=2478468 RepID=A0A3P4B0I4_9BURK|nr:GntR family transcriptional regulator [Pigmentiphaga humi]VCU69240.1 HTH-type transcriptional repressor CsiR [Pigmentiphaga humi]
MKTTSPTDAATETTATRAYELLRRDILFGTFRPGSRLSIDGLRERYKIGPIPLREALNRLAAELLIKQSDQRGFFVRDVSVTEIRQLGDTRCWVNEIMVRESFKNESPEWEKELIVAAHHLFRTPRTPSDSTTINPDWEARHRHFHMVLVADCPSEWLQKFNADLFDYTDFYRNQYLSAKPAIARDIHAEHQALFEAALSRDTAALTEALNAHVRQTVQTLISVLAASSG